MRNVYIYCEGQTEESFINEVLYPYLLNIDIVVYPIICATKRTPNKKYKGGVSNYVKIKKELILLCKQHHNAYITTMFDYYALPDDTPEINCIEPNVYNRVKYIEHAIDLDINQQNCNFHLMLHEFEGILFSKPDSFALIANDDVVRQIKEIYNNYKTPEHINNSSETAPSKRLEALIPNYAKVKNGTLLSKDMGINIMMEQCLHFREWIQKIKTI